MELQFNSVRRNNSKSAFTDLDVSSAAKLHSTPYVNINVKDIVKVVTLIVQLLLCPRQVKSAIFHNHVHVYGMRFVTMQQILSTVHFI